MEMTVVSVVIRIGRSLVCPLRMSASSTGIRMRSSFTPSTYRIPLFTTIPTSIRIPIREVILMGSPVINRRPREPIRLNGMLSMTISEYFGDSNCMAMTSNTRNMAAAIAQPSAVKDSTIISSMEFCASSTVLGRLVCSASSSICSCMPI